MPEQVLCDDVILKSVNSKMDDEMLKTGLSDDAGDIRLKLLLNDVAA